MSIMTLDSASVGRLKNIAEEVLAAFLEAAAPGVPDPKLALTIFEWCILLTLKHELPGDFLLDVWEGSFAQWEKQSPPWYEGPDSKLYGAAKSGAIEHAQEVGRRALKFASIDEPGSETPRLTGEHFLRAHSEFLAKKQLEGNCSFFCNPAPSAK
ncbi:MAG TPA: hypothetical protein PK413_15435 [Thermoanaerobaculia bacterium]|nr:hypothetical protein [Thermoanaerobaculia bacterium]